MLKFLTALASYIIPVYILITLICAWRKKTDVYPCFLVGAKEGISSAFSILPYMVGMLFAIGLWRASGIMEGIGALIDKGLSLLGVPEGLSMMLLLRPLSGSAALGRIGPDIFHLWSGQSPGTPCLGCLWLYRNNFIYHTRISGRGGYKGQRTRLKRFHAFHARGNNCKHMDCKTVFPIA